MGTGFARAYRAERAPVASLRPAGRAARDIYDRKVTLGGYANG